MIMSGRTHRCKRCQKPIPTSQILCRKCLEIENEYNEEKYAGSKSLEDSDDSADSSYSFTYTRDVL